MTKIKQLEIVRHVKKEWKTDNGIIMPFFNQKKGRYELHTWKEDDGATVNIFYSLHKVFKNPKGRQEICLYQELINQLESGGTILVDEDILKLV